MLPVPDPRVPGTGKEMTKSLKITILVSVSKNDHEDTMCDKSTKENQQGISKEQVSNPTPSPPSVPRVGFEEYAVFDQCERNGDHARYREYVQAKINQHLKRLLEQPATTILRVRQQA